MAECWTKGRSDAMVKERLLTKEEVEGLGYDPLRCFGLKIKSKHESCADKMASIVSYNIESYENLGFFSLMPIDINAKCDCGKVYEHGDKI